MLVAWPLLIRESKRGCKINYLYNAKFFCADKTKSTYLYLLVQSHRLASTCKWHWCLRLVKLSKLFPLHSESRNLCCLTTALAQVLGHKEGTAKKLLHYQGHWMLWPSLYIHPLKTIHKHNSFKKNHWWGYAIIDLKFNSFKVWPLLSLMCILLPLLLVS